MVKWQREVWDRRQVFLQRKEECWILFLQGPFNKVKTLISNLHTGLVIICDAENDIVKVGIVSWI
jgi:hypothetical protein